MGPTKQVTYRIPIRLYEKLEKISDSLFQPIPHILRAAAAEYVRNHRPVRWANTGIEFKWPEDAQQPVDVVDEVEAELKAEDDQLAGVDANISNGRADTESDTELSDSKDKS